MWIGSAPIYTRTVGKVGVRFGSLPELQSTTGQTGSVKLTRFGLLTGLEKHTVLFLYLFVLVGFKKSQSSRLFVGLVFFELVEVYPTGRQGGFCPAGLPPTAPMVAFGEEFDVAKIIPSLQRLQ